MPYSACSLGLELTLASTRPPPTSRFFCLSVYITMYLNDHQRSAFYEALGLDTRQFDQHGEQPAVHRAHTTRASRPHLCSQLRHSPNSGRGCCRTFAVKRHSATCPQLLPAQSAYVPVLRPASLPIYAHTVIIETNRATERLFPVVPDVEDPWFFETLNKMVDLDVKLRAIDSSSMPGFLKRLAKLPAQERMASYLVQMMFMKEKQCGSVDVKGSAAAIEAMQPASY